MENNYKVTKNGCWVWNKSLLKTGYGCEHDENGKTVNAHRYYYEKLVGKIPKGMQLDHLCRNRACINPEHLDIVTPAENTRRGLVPIFNKDDIIKIRDLYNKGTESLRSIAKRFGTDHKNISAIVYLKTWKDI